MSKDNSPAFGPEVNHRHRAAPSLSPGGKSGATGRTLEC